MAARSDTHATTAGEVEEAGEAQDALAVGETESAGEGERRGEVLLAALLDGMDAALCAFDAEGTVTHWNREAERILGWTSQEAVGRSGLGGWAVRDADAEVVESRLLSAMRASGRRVHECPLLTKEGGRVLVRTQTTAVRDAEGRPAGVYCAFTEVHTRIDLERSIALSEALLDNAPWGVLIVDADLRPVVVNTRAMRALRMGRTALLGRPLADVLGEGVEELEGALQHVLAEGATSALVDLWVTLRTTSATLGSEAARAVSAARARTEPSGPMASGSSPVRGCWRSGFVRLSSPLSTAEPAPLGVAWIFHDITEAKLAEQRSARLRFRDSQSQRSTRAAAECEDPMEGALLHLDFALAGFADHALLDVVSEDGGSRLYRAAQTPVQPPGPCPPAAESGIPVAYRAGHPALRSLERGASVRTSVDDGAVAGWAEARCWTADAVHGMCSVLRSRGRTLGVVTFLRSASRRPFDREDARYAEDVALRVAAAVDLAATTSTPRG